MLKSCRGKAQTKFEVIFLSFKFAVIFLTKNQKFQIIDYALKAFGTVSLNGKQEEDLASAILVHLESLGSLRLGKLAEFMVNLFEENLTLPAWDLILSRILQMLWRARGDDVEWNGIRIKGDQFCAKLVDKFMVSF